MQTFRRRYLDSHLAQTAFRQAVLDIGGEKVRRRGSFVPPMQQVSAWHTANLDPATAPDLCCDAANLPVPDASYDMALLCETLEHVASPEAVLAEACRVLKPGGTLVLSAPLLFAVHGDPADYQRWTAAKLRKALKEAGFEAIQLTAMGGIGAVVHDLAISLWSASRWRYLCRLLRPFCAVLERLQVGDQSKVTSGYFVLADKRGSQA
jgi:SAM-dependent methyltransferase